MNIVLTNDDGIKSKRLALAEEVLIELGHSVTVVAPLFEQSAKSMAMTPKGVSFTRINTSHYAVVGTPVDCVNFALQGIDLNPDLIVSGINNGFNLGIDIYYSGTVGAAFQAQYHGVPSMAFSADYRFEGDLKKAFSRTFKRMIDENLPSRDYVINVNFPPKIKRVKYVETTPVSFKSRLEGSISGSRFEYRRQIIEQKLAKDTDYFNYLKGKITYSKLAMRLKD